MEALKKFFTGIWGVVIAVFGVLLFFLYRNKDKVAQLGANLKKASTEKEVALVEKDIEYLKKDMGVVLENNKRVDKLQEDVQKQKAKVAKEQANKSDKEIEDFWKSN